MTLVWFFIRSDLEVKNETDPDPQHCLRIWNIFILTNRKKKRGREGEGKERGEDGARRIQARCVLSPLRPVGITYFFPIQGWGSNIFFSWIRVRLSWGKNPDPALNPDSTSNHNEVKNPTGSESECSSLHTNTIQDLTKETYMDPLCKKYRIRIIISKWKWRK